MALAGRSLLVTGGAGFIGSHLVERLAREGPRRLVVVDNLFLGREENLAPARASYPGLAFYAADAAAPRALERIMVAEQTEIVFSLATVPLPASLVRPRYAASVNFRLAVAAVELCRKNAFQTLVHCSSSEVYGSAAYAPIDEDHPLLPRTPYAASKAAADLLIRSYWETFDIDAVIVRPFNNYGPRQNSASYAGIIPLTLKRLFRGQRAVIQGDGEQTRDFTWVGDTVEGIVSAAANASARKQVLNLASGQEVTIRRLVTLLGHLAGVSRPPRFVGPRPGDVRRHLADVSRARSLLGFRPETALDAGLERTVAWYRAQLRPGAAS